MPPPLAVTVTTWFPSAALFPTFTVMVDFPAPGAAMELGLKLTLWLLPPKPTDKAIAALKPPETVVVIVVVPELPRTTLIVEGDAPTVKFGFGPVTVSETLVVSVMEPDVPVTVMLYVPATVDEAAVIVMVEVPVPVIEVGLNVTVTPVGWPLAVKATAESKPPVTVLVMADVPELPCDTVTEVGEAERVKPGGSVVPVSALIRPLPFGLPQPLAKS